MRREGKEMIIPTNPRNMAE